MTAATQLARWVEGISIHRGASRKKGECVPDFSCCVPLLQQPREVRERFEGAGPAQRHRMLLEFLGALIAHRGVKAHIAGQPEQLHLLEVPRR